MMKILHAVTLTFVALSLAGNAVAQTYSEAAFDSDRIRTTGGSDSPDLYGSGNDDTFQSYAPMSFNMTAADFGGTVDMIDSACLTLTFNDRTFSDGTQFELFFTSDDFDATYTGLTFDGSGASDPNGILASQFTSLTSLGVYDLGFDITDPLNGGMQFTYAVDFSAVEAELLGEINSGSDFTILLAAVNNVDDITFSGVGNTFDPGDPLLKLTVPEPSAICLLVLGCMAVFCRR